MTSYIGDHAIRFGAKPALVDAETGQVMSFAYLNARSNRLAQLFHSAGLRRGDHVAIMMENRAEFAEVAWAAMRSGLYLTTVNRFFTAAEAAFVVADCEARAFVSSPSMLEVVRDIPASVPGYLLCLMLDEAVPGWELYEPALADASPEPLAEEWLGDVMLYTSGTTGKPKGVRRPLIEAKVHDTFRTEETIAEFAFGPDTVYLSTAPLYHSAPLAYLMAVQHAGGTVVLMHRFDPVESLRLIEQHRVTHSQWVPTMFVRLLKLPIETRRAYNLSSLRYAIHAAAPCPVMVKQAMMEWWGPILHEYYAGTETNGMTRIKPEEWLERPGSVGRARSGIIHICGEDGLEQPVGEIGLIYFEQPRIPFEYFKDPVKTELTRHPVHRDWTTIGDMGFLDIDNYLFLTDRKAFMIISGGVNIYPQQVEDALVLHPLVYDVAVFGVPSVEMGEDVRAVIELITGVAPSPDLAQELRQFLSGRVARYMIPRAIDFTDDMPRLPTGKLYKAVLKARYVEADKTPGLSASTELV